MREPCPIPARRKAGADTNVPQARRAAILGEAILTRVPVSGQTASSRSVAASVALAAGNRAFARLLRQASLPAAGTHARDGGTAPASAPKPPAWATDDLKRKLAAVILAEADPGQEGDIRWIYLHRLTKAGGETGLSGSSAYSRNLIWYRIWLQILGDASHGSDTLPALKEFADFKGQTIADFVTKNGWIAKFAVPRAERVKKQVDEMFTSPGINPYRGWEGQGNLADFNNESNNDIYWKQARAYYWLQQEGKVSDVYVKVLSAGAKSTVLFNAAAIAAYWAKHPLPASVRTFAP